MTSRIRFEHDTVTRAVLGLYDSVTVARFKRARTRDGGSLNVTVQVSARAFADLIEAVEARYPELINDYVALAERIERDERDAAKDKARGKA